MLLLHSDSDSDSPDSDFGPGRLTSASSQRWPKPKRKAMVTRPNIDSKRKEGAKKASNHTPHLRIPMMNGAMEGASLARIPMTSKIRADRDQARVGSWLPVGHVSNRDVRPSEMSLFRAVLGVC